MLCNVSCLHTLDWHGQIKRNDNANGNPTDSTPKSCTRGAHGAKQSYPRTGSHNAHATLNRKSQPIHNMHFVMSLCETHMSHRALDIGGNTVSQMPSLMAMESQQGRAMRQPFGSRMRKFGVRTSDQCSGGGNRASPSTVRAHRAATLLQRRQYLWGELRWRAGPEAVSTAGKS